MDVTNATDLSSEHPTLRKLTQNPTKEGVDT